MQRVSAEGTDAGRTADRRRAGGAPSPGHRRRGPGEPPCRSRRSRARTRCPSSSPRNFRPDLDDGETVDPRPGDVDEWGRSEHMRSIVRRLYDPMYRYWFRVEWEGLEKIPDHGGALLIANHAGAIPSDAPAIMHGIEEELGPAGLRPGRLLLPDRPGGGHHVVPDRRRARPTPTTPTGSSTTSSSWPWSSPRGPRPPSKTYTDRYRLRRFGRGGFVEIAMRAGVPVIPIAVVGAEESMPILFRLPVVAKALKLPYFPVTANHCSSGPPRLRRPTSRPSSSSGCSTRSPSTWSPDQERYSRSRVMDEAEPIRAKLQDTLHDMLRERRSVWFG